MIFKHRMTVVAVSLSVALMGCGSVDTDGEDIASGNTSITVPSTDGRGEFFNADAGIGFASSLGNSLSFMSNRAVGSSSTVFADASQNNDPASGIYNDDTGVNQCDSGSISDSVGTDSNGELESASIVFNNCVIDGQTSTGSMSFVASSSGNSEVLSISFDDFASTGPEGNSSMDGDIVIGIKEDFSATISGSNLTISDDNDTTVFSNYNLATQSDIDTGATEVGGKATVTSSADGTINFAIAPAFSSGSGDENPTSGVMTMVHADGSSMVIDAGTGDPSTYAYTISGGGSVTSGVGSWDDEDFVVPVL